MRKWRTGGVVTAHSVIAAPTGVPSTPSTPDTQTAPTTTLPVTAKKWSKSVSTMMTSLLTESAPKKPVRVNDPDALDFVDEPLHEIVDVLEGMTPDELFRLCRAGLNSGDARAVAAHRAVQRALVVRVNKVLQPDIRLVFHRMIEAFIGTKRRDTPTDIDVTMDRSDVDEPMVRMKFEAVAALAELLPLPTKLDDVLALANVWRTDPETRESDRELAEVLCLTIEEARAARARAASPVVASKFLGAEKPRLVFGGSTIEQMRAWGAYWLGSRDLTKMDIAIIESLRDEWFEQGRESLRGKLSEEAARMMRDFGIDMAFVSPSWAACGFPIVEPTHMLAASLMATWMPPEHAPELRVPWETFLIRIPQGLIPRPTHPDEQPLAFVYLMSTDKAQPVIGFGTETKCIFISQPIDSLASLVGKADAQKFARLASVIPLPKLDLLLRFVVGVLVELDTPPNRTAIAQGAPSSSAGTKSSRSGPPKSWVFVLRRNVKIDARAWVKAYALGHGDKGAKGALGVQILVRGHHKRQVHGAGRLLRKWIHVEPYWRGPEDAPIAARAHTIDASRAMPNDR